MGLGYDHSEEGSEFLHSNTHSEWKDPDACKFTTMEPLGDNILIGTISQ